MKTIAVIGAGTMGNGIAHTFAQSGFTVKLIDVSEKSLEKAMATIASNLDRMVIALFTLEEYAQYIQISSNLNRRMMNMLVERLKSQVQVIEQ